METVFAVTVIVCCVLAWLQRHPALSDDPAERAIAVVTAATVLLYGWVFALSCLGVRWPYGAATAATAGLSLLLLLRLRRRGACGVTAAQALGLAGFLLVGLGFLGLAFSFGARFVMDNVDVMAHIATGQRFLKDGMIEVDTPFRYPPLTGVMLGSLMGALPRVPQYLACQGFSALLLLGVALAARQIAGRLSGRTSFGTDLLILTTAFSSMLMYALISGFTSLLAGVFFLLATLLGGSWHRRARTQLSLTTAALPVLAVAGSYYLFFPIAFGTWYLCLPDLPPGSGWRMHLRALLRPAVLRPALLLLSASAVLVFFYVPVEPLGIAAYLDGYLLGLSKGVEHLTAPGGSLVNLRLYVVSLPLLLAGLAGARRRSPYLASVTALGLLAFGAAHGAHLAGRLSEYYFSKFAALCDAYALFGLAAGIAAVRERSRPAAAVLLLLLVGAGAVPLLGARTERFAETTAAGRYGFGLARQITPFAVANSCRLSRRPLLSTADDEAARYISANAATVLDAGAGRLTAAGAGVPLYFYERNRAIPLVFLLQGGPADVYKAYFNGTRTFEQWLEAPSATHLLVVDTGGDMASVHAQARGAGLAVVFERGNVTIFRKPPPGPD